MISEKTLVDLKNLLLGWNISPDDWYVTGEAAMVLSGYPVTFRDQQMDILVCRNVWPWARPEEQVSLFPDAGTEAEKQLHEFIEKNKITPDFHPLPHVGIEATDRFEHSYIFSSTSGVRVLSPWAGVWHRKLIIEFYEQTPGFSSRVFDKNKFLRWKKFMEETRAHAEKIGDEKTSTVCLQVLPVVERAINFFNSDDDTDFLKGSSVCSGRVTGEVAFWQDGIDLSDKIVVLKHALPYQFTQLAKAKGIITEEGGLLSHAAVIAREYNVPAIVGVTKALQNFSEGDRVELDATVGTVKKIFSNEERLIEDAASLAVATNKVLAARARGENLDENFIERAAVAVHEAWLKRNFARAGDELKVSYLELSDEEKEKDRVFVRRAMKN